MRRVTELLKRTFKRMYKTWRDRPYEISEVFESWIGEGAHTGLPATFVRFSGCNLDCEGCDTPQKSRVTFMTHFVEEVVEYISLFSKRRSPFYHWLVLTGGEPMLQVDFPLIRALIEAGWIHIHIETNGTVKLPYDEVERFIWNEHPICKVWYAVSPKSNLVIPEVFSQADEIKIVIPKEMTWFTRIVEREQYQLQSKCIIWLMPWMDDKYEENLDETLRLSKLWNVPVTLQWHKLVGWR